MEAEKDELLKKHDTAYVTNDALFKTIVSQSTNIGDETALPIAPELQKAVNDSYTVYQNITLAASKMERITKSLELTQKKFALEDKK